MRSPIVVLVLAAMSLRGVAGWQATPEPPRFEVASLRLAAPGAAFVSPYGGNRWSVAAMRVPSLLQRAFGGDNTSEIVGLPDWCRTQFYSVAAKAEDGVILNRDTLRPRLRNLLEERFKLVTHIETSYVKGFALVVVKDASKLTPTTNDAAMTAIGSGRVRGPSVTMELFAGALAGLLRLEMGKVVPVVDETGLTGNYDVSLSFAPLVDAGVLPREADSPLPSLFTALQEQLGLRLVERDKLPVKTLVIDHIEHPTVD